MLSSFQPLYCCPKPEAPNPRNPIFEAPKPRSLPFSAGKIQSRVVRPCLFGEAFGALFRVQDLGFRALGFFGGLGFRVLGFRVFGFRV